MSADRQTKSDTPTRDELAYLSPLQFRTLAAIAEVVVYGDEEVFLRRRRPQR